MFSKNAILVELCERTLEVHKDFLENDNIQLSDVIILRSKLDLMMDKTIKVIENINDFYELEHAGQMKMDDVLRHLCKRIAIVTERLANKEDLTVNDMFKARDNILSMFSAAAEAHKALSEFYELEKNT